MFVTDRLCVRNACIFFFQAEDGIRDLVRSRGLGDVYKRQLFITSWLIDDFLADNQFFGATADPTQPAQLLLSSASSKTAYGTAFQLAQRAGIEVCLLYTSDAADERSSVDLGGRRIIKKKKIKNKKLTLIVP